MAKDSGRDVKEQYCIFLQRDFANDGKLVEIPEEGFA